MKTARYRCMKCEHEFQQLQGGKEHPPPDGCPGCGSLYLDWLNYREDFANKEK